MKNIKSIFANDDEWNLATKVWWAFFWRTWAFSLIAACVSLSIYHLTVRFMGIDPLVKEVMSVGLGVTVGMISGIWVVKHVLLSGFGKYNIRIVEKK